jgi:uncharacterized protein
MLCAPFHNLRLYPSAEATQMSTSITATPVNQSERIFTLDMVRGIAVLGILLMNIPLFSTPDVLANDPSLANELGTINYYIWYSVTWIFNGTQRALFSLLFGAGIILFVSRQEKKLTGLAPADYFFRRQLWLILFSLVDVYILLWNGDILLDYACFGMMLFVFRNLAPRTLIIAGCICVLLMTARENRDLYQRKETIQKGEAIAALDTTVTKLNGEQKAALAEMQNMKARFQPEAKLKRAKETIEKVTHSYASVYEFRTNDYIENLTRYIYFWLWDVLIFMLFGMAFFKLGILTGTVPIKVYAWMCICGLSIGLTLSWFNVQNFIDNNFNRYEVVKNSSFLFHELTRTPRAIGILGLIMLLYKSNWLNPVFKIFRPVGQMAFTNYLMQSLICGILFNAYGFRLYGQLQRYETYIVVLCIWIFQICFSTIWMRYYLYGPFEWAWRSLTYWKRQPFVRRKVTMSEVLAVADNNTTQIG